MHKPNTNFITAALATATLAATALIVTEARRSAKDKSATPPATRIDLSGPEPICVTHHRRGIPVFSVYQY